MHSSVAMTHPASLIWGFVVGIAGFAMVPVHRQMPVVAAVSPPSWIVPILAGVAVPLTNYALSRYDRSRAQRHIAADLVRARLEVENLKGQLLRATGAACTRPAGDDSK